MQQPRTVELHAVGVSPPKARHIVARNHGVSRSLLLTI